MSNGYKLSTFSLVNSHVWFQYWEKTYSVVIRIQGLLLFLLYSVRNISVINEHFSWLESANIGVVAVSWYPPGSWKTRRNIKNNIHVVWFLRICILTDWRLYMWFGQLTCFQSMRYKSNVHEKDTFFFVKIIHITCCLCKNNDWVHNWANIWLKYNYPWIVGLRDENGPQSDKMIPTLLEVAQKYNLKVCNSWY